MAPQTQTPSYLRYPYQALLDTTDYLRVDLLSYDYVRKSAGLGPGSLTRNAVAFDTTTTSPQKAKTLKGSILLPIPSNVQDGNSVSYSDSSLDGLTAQVYDVVASNTQIGSGSLSDVSNALGNTIKKVGQVLTSEEARSVFTKSIAAQAANIPFGGNLTLSQILARESGQILNPNMELLFNGVTLRSFKFSFKMTPRNEREAQEIRTIIKSFKLNMAPKAQSDVFLKTPNVFQLSYRKGDQLHPYLNMFKQCFLTDMSVNYTGEGIYSTYSDGSPISYVMDLGFKELEPIYEGDYTLAPPNSVGF